jgi:hypothetical protein
MATRHLQYRPQGSPGRTAGAALRHLLIIAFFSCSVAASAQLPLKNGASSLNNLAGQVLGALHRKDFKTLDALRINEQEYRSCIWPELPISKIEQWKKRYDFVWGDVDTKCVHGLREMIHKYGGRELTFVSLRFAGETSRYTSCIVHQDARITVKDSAGAVQELKLFGSVVECGGRFKIMSYNVH